jgi:hypothetical protein
MEPPPLADVGWQLERPRVSVAGHPAKEKTNAEEQVTQIGQTAPTDNGAWRCNAVDDA